jgi:regulation of enolase protein 1 (concanavalin A-like superfamily)
VGTDTGWGGLTFEDPDKDCQFTPGPGGLVVAVPAAPHDLGGPLRKSNSPRALREVDGDFVLTVRVAGDFTPGARSTLPRSVPYLGAGVLVWSDADNFIRLERVAMLSKGQLVPQIAFLEQEGGFSGPPYTPSVPEGAYYLRLERAGNRFLGAFSLDGAAWKQFKPRVNDWPSKLKVGLTAISTSSEPFSAKFEQFDLKPKGP